MENPSGLKQRQFLTVAYLSVPGSIAQDILGVKML